MSNSTLLPWKITNSELELSTPWFNIVKYSCETPTGRLVPAYYVHEAPDSVMCVCMTKDGLIVLERQYRFPLRSVSMDYPAGSVLPEETLEQAALRELLEETGFAAESATHLFSLAKDPSFSAGKMHVFVARNGYRKSTTRDAAEPVVIDLLQPRELLRAVEDGQMPCAFCVATTFRVAQLLGWYLV